MEKILPLVTKDFENFVYKILKLGRLKERGIALLMKRENLVKFRQCFIHITFSPEYNWETYEFMGDGFLKAATVRYIQIRFPGIVSTKWLTRLKHHFESKGYLARMAEDLGFWKYIVYGDLMQEKLNECEALGQIDLRLGLLEDAFEAFVGCAVTIFNEKTVPGVGDAFAYYLYRYAADKINIELNNELFDPITRLKELTYDRAELKERGWTQDKTVRQFPLEDPEDKSKQEIVIYDPEKSYLSREPKDKRLKPPAQRVILAQVAAGVLDKKTGEILDIKRAKEKAATIAIRVLLDPRGDYRMKEIIKNPYESNRDVTKQINCGVRR